MRLDVKRDEVVVVGVFPDCHNIFGDEEVSGDAGTTGCGAFPRLNLPTIAGELIHPIEPFEEVSVANLRCRAGLGWRSEEPANAHALPSAENYAAVAAADVVY